MRMWIDTEFNEYRGDLISMAIVDEDGREWYEATHCPNPKSWVAKHVMPCIGIAPISRSEMRASLSDWLARYNAMHLVADWPEDIEHFLSLLIVGPGQRIDTPPLTMEVLRDLGDTAQTSIIPHNALEDAKALRLSHLSKAP